MTDEEIYRLRTKDFSEREWHLFAMARRVLSLEEISIALDVAEESYRGERYRKCLAYLRGFEVFEKYEESTWLQVAGGGATESCSQQVEVIRHVTPPGWRAWISSGFDEHHVRFEDQRGIIGGLSISGKLLAVTRGSWKNNTIYRALFAATVDIRNS